MREQFFCGGGIRVLFDSARVSCGLYKSEHINQSALIEAINRLMAEWGEPVVADVGSAGKGRTK